MVELFPPKRMVRGGTASSGPRIYDAAVTFPWSGCASIVTVARAVGCGVGSVVVDFALARRVGQEATSWFLPPQ